MLSFQSEENGARFPPMIIFPSPALTSPHGIALKLPFPFSSSSSSSEWPPLSLTAASCTPGLLSCSQSQHPSSLPTSVAFTGSFLVLILAIASLCTASPSVGHSGKAILFVWRDRKVFPAFATHIFYPSSPSRRNNCRLLFVVFCFSLGHTLPILG